MRRLASGGCLFLAACGSSELDERGVETIELAASVHGGGLTNDRIRSYHFLEYYTEPLPNGWEGEPDNGN